MNFLLFFLEIIVVMAGIALVPAQSISRSRDTYTEREREKYLRS
jgi:hypothetical protein